MNEQLGFYSLMTSATLDALELVERQEREAAHRRPLFWATCYERGGFNYPTRRADSRAELEEFVAEALGANTAIKYVDLYSPSGEWLDRVGRVPADGMLVPCPESEPALAARRRRAA